MVKSIDRNPSELRMTSVPTVCVSGNVCVHASVQSLPPLVFTVVVNSTDQLRKVLRGV